MKKFSLILVILLLTSASFGQFSVGPRVGVNFATITGKHSEYDDSKSGWIAGLVIGAVGNYEYTDMVSFSAELLFITMGDKTTYSETDIKSSQSDYNYTIIDRSHYIMLPILARFSFGSNFLFYGNLGPYFGYDVGGHYKFEEGGNVTKGRYRYNEDKVKGDDVYLDPDDNRRFDVGMYIGGGVGKDVGPGRLEADLRFGIGFLDRNKFDSKEDKQSHKDNGYKSSRNMNICLTLVYMYPFGNGQATRYSE